METRKQNYYIISTLICVTIASFSFIPADNPDAIVGTWLTGGKNGKIQIYKEGHKYCGKLVWMDMPNDPQTKRPKVDNNNPDPQKRNQPLLGLELLRDFRYDGENVWDSGKIYDPESGKVYSCKMTLRGNNTLEVRGYVGISLIGRTETWQRVKQ
ncbi:DUF2147 domain-containing protein [Persicitalea jodogahamensis]|uniref:DUF2147 domain-containing protein n=1 Tax=Persicitalea jodogahamensis TaxID=402147 RepID=UPI0016773B61|nr:DUF2147 domain-containing protein [Persicitalea jodogahamensis]